MSKETQNKLSGVGMFSRREALKGAGAMLGLALTPRLLAGVESWAPSGSLKTLSGESAKTLSALIDFLLPKTDTLGGLEVGTLEFVDLILDKYLEGKAKQRILLGLRDLEEEAQSRSGKSFAAIDAKEREAIYLSWAKGAEKQKGFLSAARNWILLGYFSSEEVGKKVLKFDPIPGEYRGCIDLSETGGVAWTL